MNIISKKKLLAFWKAHPGVESPIKEWHAKAKSAKWRTPDDINSTL